MPTKETLGASIFPTLFKSNHASQSGPRAALRMVYTEDCAAGMSVRRPDLYQWHGEALKALITGLQRTCLIEVRGQ